jgi:DNA-binding CsgD family transcriptional regulator
MPMIQVLEARLLQVDLNYRAGYWDQAAADGERLITLIDDLDQGWLLRRAHLAAMYSAVGRGHWHAASGHADAAAAQPGAGPLALADARTAIAVARDDLPAILAAAADAADPGLLRHLEPSRVPFWPAYAVALAGPDRPPLTACQLLVARASAAGKSNREIAAELYISVKTVEFHLGQILARLDLDSRTQIADALAAPSAAAAPTQSPTADRPGG